MSLILFSQTTYSNCQIPWSSSTLLVTSTLDFLYCLPCGFGKPLFSPLLIYLLDPSLCTSSHVRLVPVHCPSGPFAQTSFVTDSPLSAGHSPITPVRHCSENTESWKPSTVTSTGTSFYLSTVSWLFLFRITPKCIKKLMGLGRFIILEIIKHCQCPILFLSFLNNSGVQVEQAGLFPHSVSKESCWDKEKWKNKSRLHSQ